MVETMRQRLERNEMKRNECMNEKRNINVRRCTFIHFTTVDGKRKRTARGKENGSVRNLFRRFAIQFYHEMKSTSTATSLPMHLYICILVYFFFFCFARVCVRNVRSVVRRKTRSKCHNFMHLLDEGDFEGELQRYDTQKWMHFPVHLTSISNRKFKSFFVLFFRSSKIY